MRLTLLASCFLILAVFPAFSQLSNHTEVLVFNNANKSPQITMGGWLDGENTFSYPRTRAFQPMKRLTVSNKGNNTVVHPRILINNIRNWYDITSLRAECFAGAISPKEKALSLWKFMRDNRLHYNEPDQGREVGDPIKFLGVYGYGPYYNTSDASAFLASTFPYSQATYKEYSSRGRHSVKDYLFDTTYMLVDSDIEVFYLRYDNKAICAYNEIANDKYLIHLISQ